MPKNSTITVTDFFCGAGGSSQGARRLGCEVQLAANHWQLAVETHAVNFPDTEHDVVDLRQIHPGRYWATNILIISPECTNHSIAKGRKRLRPQRSLLDEEGIDPSAVRSRATMWTVPDYAEHYDYEIIVVENVVDARFWRPWDGWITAMRNLGYDYEIVYFNSMFAHLRPLQNPRYGDYAPQSRDRMYVVFWKRGNKKPDLEFRPLAYCPHCERDVEAVQSWKKKPGQPFWRWGRYGERNQYVYRCPHCAHVARPYYYAAANAIDWTLPAERIGDRKRPLRPKTLERIKAGIEKFAGQRLVVDLAYANDQTTALLMPFVLDTLYTMADKPPTAVTGTLPTQTARQSLAVAMPFYLGYANGDGPPHSVTDALLTIHTENGHGVAIPPMMVKFRNNQDAKMLDDPMGTITAAGGHHGLLLPPFLMSYYGSNGNHRTVGDPMGSLTAVDRHALVQPGETPDVEDYYFRMLQPQEIGRGMAFDDGYVVKGTKRDKVRQYGNAVTPPVMEMILERCVESLK